MSKRNRMLLVDAGKVETISRRCRSLEQQLDSVAAELEGKSKRNPAVLNKKFHRVTAALAKTTCQLDHMAEEFTPQQATSRHYQLA